MARVRGVGQQVRAAVAQRLARLEAMGARHLWVVYHNYSALAQAKVVGPLRYADHVETRGEDLFREARARGLEGVVAKRADAPYRAGRSPAWLKLRVQRSDDFAVVGFTEPSGSRAGFGALHLAFHDGKGFVYAGSVGSGFSGEQLAALRGRLERGRRPSPPFRGAVPPGRDDVWVDPQLVVEVRYLEWTEEGLLRQPVFERLREDKRPEDCSRPGAGDEPPPVAPAPPVPEDRARRARSSTSRPSPSASRRRRPIRPRAASTTATP